MAKVLVQLSTSVASIVGRSNCSIRLGALRFKGKFSVLENTRVDFIIGLDILRKFQCDICLRQNVIKLFHHGKVFRVPILSQSNPMSYETYHDRKIEESSSCNRIQENVDEEDEMLSDDDSISMEGW